MLTPRQWMQVRRLFTEASRLDVPQRETFLTHACPQEIIRAEVESLLRQEAKTQNFLGLVSSISGKPLSHYEINERIGEGGMAVVYKARDERMGRWVAIKVLQPWAMGRADSRERLIQEARCASALNHPNIITVYEVGQENDVCFIVMEHVSGKTLRRTIPSKGLSVPAALSCAAQIGDALDAAHSAGIVHGDLQPSNIMITDRGHAKLLDFGLSWMTTATPNDSTGGLPPRRFGTKAYMAPELLTDQSRDPDPRSEIFSFGLILQEMLTGGHAYGSGTRETIAQLIVFGTPEVLPGKVPDSVAGVVRRCLEKSPERRFQSMRELLTALVDGAQLRGRRKSSTEALSTAHRLNDFQQAQGFLAEVTFQNLARSRRALENLTQLFKGGVESETRDAVTAALKDIILTVHDFGGDVIPATVRTVRKLAFDVVRISTDGRLDQYFDPSDFEDLDLYGMDFASGPLTGFSFKGCFLVEAEFQRATLIRASLTGSSVRNVNFENADVAGADFSDADWFNAVGWRVEQLKSVKPHTLLTCPADPAAMHRYLESHYVVPFSAWSGQVQKQLLTAWTEYLRPNGLRDIVSQWRRATQK